MHMGDRIYYLQHDINRDPVVKLSLKTLFESCKALSLKVHYDEVFLVLILHVNEGMQLDDVWAVYNKLGRIKSYLKVSSRSCTH